MALLDLCNKQLLKKFSCQIVATSSLSVGENLKAVTVSESYGTVVMTAAGHGQYGGVTEANTGRHANGALSESRRLLRWTRTVTQAAARPGGQ